MAEHLDVRVRKGAYSVNVQVEVYNANTDKWVEFGAVSPYYSNYGRKIQRMTRKAKRHYTRLDKQGVAW